MDPDASSGAGSATGTVILARRGALGLVTLNRPSALNALDLDMIRALDRGLRRWAEDDAIERVAIRGAGGRAFCAGGDVVAVARAGLAARRGEPGALPADFFREEYRLNHLIHTYPKPFVALVDGICMGGGFGLSVHGAVRVATERLVLAMPETTIGLFPDVGGGWVLPRWPGELGTWFALTGARAGAADALALGFATHHVPSARLEPLIAALAEPRGNRGGDPAAIVARFATDPGPAPILGRRATIDRCFGRDTMEEILAALAAEGSGWADAVAATLRAMSPTSCMVALRQLRLGRRLSYPEMVTVEYRLAQACLDGHDFYEGVRAQLIDKDKAPIWHPATLEEVDDSLVARHFAPQRAPDLFVGPAGPPETRPGDA